MRSKLQKSIALLLTLITLLSLTLPAISASAEQNENLPIVFLGGKGTYLEDADGNQVYPLSYDNDYIVNSCKEVLPILAKCVVTNNYDAYCDALYNCVAKVYDKMPLDCNGNVDNGTGTDFTWSRTTLSWSVKDDEPYGFYDYPFYYDWRLDPWETADKLNEYIKDILAVTGAPKIKLVGRCMGGNIVMAYLTKYGCADVERCLFYCTTALGTSECGGPFSGQLELDSDAIDRFAYDMLGNDPTNELIKASISLLNESYKLELPIAAITAIYNKVKANIVPRLLLATYATFPSYWSMVGDDYYEAAKQNVFGGKEDEYSGMIAKIDNVHYNVQNNTEKNLKKFMDEGMKLSVVCKYGRQIIPIVKQKDINSDTTVELSRASFGATASSVSGTLSAAYIGGVEAAGNGKYISPDKQVDASTCLLPDSTWFIKGITHSEFPQSIDDLMVTILRYDGTMTVNDNSSYPQYMVYNKNTSSIEAMTADNCETADRDGNFFKAIYNFTVALFRCIRNYLSTLFNKNAG